jgi:hypothetical protein
VSMGANGFNRWTKAFHRRHLKEENDR